MGKLSKYLFGFLMVISLFVIVRHSSISVIDLPFNLENIFIKPQSDEICFNLSIGYVVSSIFYLIVVYYPDMIRKKKVRKVALYEIATVCTDAIILITLMYKNVSLKSEWNYKHVTDDSMFFDEDFYRRMRLFDVYKEADTRFCHTEEPYNILTWNEKLQNDLEDYVRRVDETINRYLFWLDDDITESALAFKYNNFIAIFLGLPTNELGVSATGENGRKYAERFPLHLLFNNSSKKRTPIFGEDNGDVLKSYVDTLLKLRSYCYNTKGFDQDRAVGLFCKENYGQCGIAILED